jgi:hypothetical protein
MDGEYFAIMEFKYKVEQPGRIVHDSGVMYLLLSFLDPRPVTQSAVLRRPEIDWSMVVSIARGTPGLSWSSGVIGLVHKRACRRLALRLVSRTRRDPLCDQFY